MRPLLDTHVLLAFADGRIPTRRRRNVKDTTA